MEAEGRVAKQVGGCGYFAAVRIRLVLGHTDSVAVEPSAVSDYDRGLGWGEAAAAGAALGMSLACVVGSCVITGVRGMVCDTSPALIAIAAARAVWDASGFVPPSGLAAKVEACVVRGHKLSPDQVGSELLADESPTPNQALHRTGGA